MSNSKLARALMSALILALPAVAAIDSDLHLRIGGADQTGPFDYVAYEETVVVLAVHALPGDIVALFAKLVDGRDEPVATLMLDKAGGDGLATTQVKIPKGVSGLSFELVAFSMSPEGDIASTLPVQVHIE